MLPLSGIIISLVLVSGLIKSAAPAVCVYANCEPVEDFLASASTPHIISECANCYECTHSNFSTCTLVHTKETEARAHCVCGNTLPTLCESDHVLLGDILNYNASHFDHDYMCSFSLEDEKLRSYVLPQLEDVHIPHTVNETGSFRVPINTLIHGRRYGDLKIKSFNFYLLNASEAESAQTSLHEPFAKVHLSEEGNPSLVEPEDAKIDLTAWPLVTFPVPPNLPTAVAYTTDHPFHRLIVDPDLSTSAKNVSIPYRQLTRASVPHPTTSGPNYTQVVLIVVGVILLIGLCCAAISCKDKLQHRQYRSKIEGEIATRTDIETGKSVALSTQPQSYTVVKNGSHAKTVEGAEHEKILLLPTQDRLIESATLPLSAASGKDSEREPSGARHNQHQTLPIVVSSGTRDNGVRSSGSKIDADPNHRSAPSIEADRKKFLALSKDATIIKAADLDLLESIGSGDFGVIRRGYVFDRTEAMIHCLRPPHKQTTEAAAEALTERLEASVKAGFHPHIVSLLGLCHEGDILYVCLQMETGPNLRNMLRESRSLDQFLQYTNARGRLSLMSPQRLLNIILGIARGMGHLEECQVLHDNLAAVNIVICDNGSPKIGGFGMATLSDLYMRQLEKNHDQLRWLPPETHDTGLFTMKSQTWSFGVVLWEIVTFGGTPYYEMSDDEVVQRVAEGYRLPRASNCSRQLFDLMEQCWRAHGEDRPDFLNIQQHVHELNLDPELHVSVTYHDGFKYQPIRETWNT